MELTLDPSDWSALRALGRDMVDDVMTHLQHLGEGPVWRPVPDAVRARLTEPLPLRGADARAVYAQFLRDVLPYPNGNAHPRFWGWVQGTGTPLAALADMLASAMNAHLAGFEQAPALVEEQVLAWLKEALGLSPASSGLLTGGGSMANLLGLAVARHARCGFDVREHGLSGGPRLAVYASSETHSWAQKACELMGIGRVGLRRLPAAACGRLPLDLLRRSIAEDRADGVRPLCVIATAGTVGTGAIDDLVGLSRLCTAESLWLHVDGAFGALAALSKKHRGLVEGLAEADSVAFDLHKWMYLPFEAACLVVRDAAVHRSAFSVQASYLAPTGRGVAAGPLRFAELGYELTRSFRALKVWFALKVYGVERLAALIEQNIEQARFLAACVRADPRLELLADVPLNIVCFRFRGGGGLTSPALDDLNRELLVRLQEGGQFVLSATQVDDRFALRAAIVNHRSRRADFELLVREVVRVGEAVLRERES